jgi:uncharacterized membrane protein
LKSLEVSRRVVTDQFGSVLCVQFLNLLILLSGLLCCGFGALIAAPVIFAINSRCYSTLFGGEE